MIKWNNEGVARLPGSEDAGAFFRGIVSRSFKGWAIASGGRVQDDSAVGDLGPVGLASVSGSGRSRWGI